MFNKKLVLALALVSSSLLFMSVSAHPGHEHPDTNEDSFLTELKAQKNSTYEIIIDDEVISNFTIKSVKPSKNGFLVKLKLDQTLDDEEETEGRRFHTLKANVTASITEEKIMTYNYASTHGDSFTMIIDFQNLAEGSNAGYRISYTTEAEDREMASEEITVSKLIADEE